jgi:hypothetical protein
VAFLLQFNCQRMPTNTNSSKYHRWRQFVRVVISRKETAQDFWRNFCGHWPTHERHLSSVQLASISRQWPLLTERRHHPALAVRPGRIPASSQNGPEGFSLFVISLVEELAVPPGKPSRPVSGGESRLVVIQRRRRLALAVPFISQSVSACSEMFQRCS